MRCEHLVAFHSRSPRAARRALGRHLGDATSARGPQCPGGLERRGGAPDHVLVHGAPGQADRAGDAARAEAAVGHHHRLAEAEQDRAPHAPRGRARSRRRPPGRGSAGRRARTPGSSGPRLAIASRTRREVPSSTLSATLPVKPSVTTTSAPRAGQVEALDVAHEVEAAGLLDPLARGEHVGRALARLLAHREEAHPWPLLAVHGLHEAGPHVGELDEVLGPRLDAGAGVEQQHGPARDREQHGQRGPVYPAQALDLQGGGGERRAGAAGGHERLGAALGHRAGGLDDRGVRLRADGLGRILVAADVSGASTTSTLPVARRRRSAAGPKSSTSTPERRAPSATAAGP